MFPRSTQAFFVDRIKRRAFRELHRTPEGERALLEIYLAAENLPGTDEVFRELTALAPEWLAPQLEARGADEARHADLLRARLAAIEEPRARRGDAAAARRERLALASTKVRQLKRLVGRWEAEFEQGRLVPLLALVLSLEETAVRVMRRHLDVLESMAVRGGGAHPTAALLSRILEDEKRHVRECERALGRLVRPAEKLSLARLTQEADEIDRSFGLTGAVGMLALGLAFRGVRLVRGAFEVAEASL